MKITKIEFERLYSKDISKKDYDDTITKINERFAEICNEISELKDRCDLLEIKKTHHLQDQINCLQDDIRRLESE